MADQRTSNLTIGASDNFQKGIANYGKPNPTDTVSLDAFGTNATFTTATDLKAGDLIIAYPFLTSGAIVTATAGDLVFTVFRFQPRIGFVEDEVTVTLAGTEDASGVQTAIEAQLVALGLDGLVKVTVQDTDKVRMQVTNITTQILVDADPTNLGFPVDERGKYAWTTLGLPLENGTDATVNQYYFTKGQLDDADRLNLEYEVSRNIGEATGSSFDIQYNTDEYKGNKPVVIQSEEVDATSQMNITALVFTYDNLKELKGWTEIAGAFDSGLSTGVRTFDFTANSKPIEFEFISIHRKADGNGLLMIYCPRVLSTQNEITLEKAFRAYDDTFEIVRANDKTVAIIINI